MNKIDRARDSHGRRWRVETTETIGNALGDVELSQDTKDTLCKVISSSKWRLLIGTPVDGVEILKSDVKSRVKSDFKSGVFALHCAPHLVFKISDFPWGLDKAFRWDNAKRAAEILKDPQFDLLVLPRQALLELPNNEYVIVEERLSLTNNFLKHKRLYESLGARLEPTLRQLVAFIIASGFRGVDFRHIPILDKESAFELAPEASPKIGLVDVSACGILLGEAARGTRWDSFFGFYGEKKISRGLFQCIVPEHFEVVKAEALKHQVTFDEENYGQALENRKDDLEEARRNRELVNDAAIYESKVKSIFETVATALSTAIPPTLEIVTEPLGALDFDHPYFAPRRFKVRPVDQPHLILRGVLVLDTNTRLLAALAMSIQGSIASSATDTSSLSQRISEFCCNDGAYLVNKARVEKLTDGGCFFCSVAAGDFFEREDWDALGMLKDIGTLSNYLGSL